MNRFLIFFAIIFPLSQGFSRSLDSLDLGGIANSVAAEREPIFRSWQGKERWKGLYKDRAWFACDGSYHFVASLKALMKTLRFELEPEQTAVAHAAFEGIEGNVSGFFRSERSYCIPFGGFVSFKVDLLEAQARVNFIEASNGKTTLKVKVLSTNFGTIHWGTRMPSWLEATLTRALNRAFTKIWGTWFGEWLSEKISERLNGGSNEEADGDQLRTSERLG